MFRKTQLIFDDAVRYLGNIVRPGTLEVDQSHVKSLSGSQTTKKNNDRASIRHLEEDSDNEMVSVQQVLDDWLEQLQTSDDESSKFFKKRRKSQ